MKKLVYYAVLLCAPTLLVAQVSFTNQSGMIGNYPDSSEIATDMNNDGLDDYVRVSQNGIGIDYQQPNGTFNSVMHSMNIQNVPNWSVAVGDLDGNGYNDFVLGNGQRVSFVMANADGTAYTENTHPEFIFSQRSTMADIDNDGDLDAFVCHDIDLSHPYRNDGSGNMTLDQTLIQTIDLPGNYANIWVDYDNDGDQDLYMTKCRGGSSPGDPERDNAMYTNNGDGTFTENAADIGMKDNAQSWTTVFEDFDNDGDFDAFIVNHDFENRFMINDGTGNFTDIISTTGINPTDLGAWENQAVDFNNDGFVDIFSEMSKELYINNGDLTFTGQDLPFDEGAIGDMNNDGFLDVVNDGNLYINDGNSNNWVKFLLVGEESNLNGIGARISIYGDWGVQIREVRSGHGFSHMNSLTAHFGLGTATTIDQVVIEWPSGTVDVIDDVQPNEQLTFVEGDNVLSVPENAISTINVFPNPTADFLNFSQEGLQHSKIQIVDANGKLVLNTTISANGSVDVTSLSSGVYIAMLQVNKQFESFKFVKR
ncbi:FG-GAP-like repeat-containing protein [Marinirhabdus gelatinilytica]|uniref:Putative secreted protein (Por secretion system target) n=1 Tax=Marinirhabdus gelatinilytica TaxID=1703343 RepID=A0A370Q7F1_9FLAO|nr:FG-GAP-like repeat-containing protein [Marinirhabdus gelatinilytica]RDK84284.1 putative secreted protein (Por secretion system target) [Marinirhabdus gelatinilytica]